MIFDALLAHVARAVHHGGLRVFGHGWDHFRHPAVEFTPSRDGDSPFVGKTVHRTVSLSSSLPERRDQIPDDEEIGTVTGDDTRRATALVGRSVHWKARGSPGSAPSAG